MQGDLFNKIKASRGVSPAAASTDNTAFTTQILDTAGFDSATLLVALGSVADADVTFTITMTEGDVSDLSDGTTVASTDVIGYLSSGIFDYSSDNKVWKVGYMGTKRYVKATITPANNTGNIFLAAIWVQGAPRTIPQSTSLV